MIGMSSAITRSTGQAMIREDRAGSVPSRAIALLAIVGYGRCQFVHQLDTDSSSLHSRTHQDAKYYVADPPAGFEMYLAENARG